MSRVVTRPFVPITILASACSSASAKIIHSHSIDVDHGFDRNSSASSFVELGAKPTPVGCEGAAVKGFDITIHNDSNVLQGICYFYGMVPWILGGLIGVFAIYLFVRVGIHVWRRKPDKPFRAYRRMVVSDCSECWLYLFFQMLVALCCFIIKKVLKEPRPEGSCLTTYGMPSGHSATSIGMIVYATVWLFFGMGTVYFAWKGRVAIFCVIVALCGPVPFSRWYIKDHSWAQIGYGSLLGCGVAVVYLFCIQIAWRGVHTRKSQKSSEINASDNSEANLCPHRRSSELIAAEIAAEASPAVASPTNSTSFDNNKSRLQEPLLQPAASSMLEVVSSSEKHCERTMTGSTIASSADLGRTRSLVDGRRASASTAPAWQSRTHTIVEDHGDEDDAAHCGRDQDVTTPDRRVSMTNQSQSSEKFSQTSSKLSADEK